MSGKRELTTREYQTAGRHRTELLLPAGSLDRLKTAILYGADAVYCGTPDMSMRTKSEFTLEDLAKGVLFAHERGKRVYLTLNLFSHNRDVEKLPRFLKTVREIGPNGILVSDPGIFHYVKEHAPELELHVSTQASVCSWLTVDSWKKQGASLVVMAREVNFQELREIREKCPDIRLEIFVHGSMCMTYSGRCLLSNYMAERRSNCGNCAHSCRWNYKLRIALKDGTTREIELNENNRELFDFFLEEEYRPGQLFPIEEDERGSYILNSKDLCLMPKLNEYLALGLDSFKIEGRHKTNYYVALTAHAYRRAIDDWYRDPEHWSHEPYMQELESVSHRGYTLAFHDGRLTNLAHDYETTQSSSPYEFAGFIRKWDKDDMIFEIRNEIKAGDMFEFIVPCGSSAFPSAGLSGSDCFHSADPAAFDSMAPIRMRLQTFEDAVSGQITEKVSAGQGKAIRIPKSIFQSVDQRFVKDLLPPLTVARKKKPVTSLSSANDHHHRQQRSSPRMGKDGCCKKGCNGCLIYWHDGHSS